MSIVRHKDKKSGSIIVYESTSHYDPVTKKSRPKKKYLGIEDPVTGELIPSSGRRGRRKASDVPETDTSKKKKPEVDYKEQIHALQGECAEKDAKIVILERRVRILRADLEKLRDTAVKFLLTDDEKNCLDQRVEE